MDTKERWTPSGARFSLPDPKLAPGIAKSGKNPIRKTGIDFKGARKFFCWSFPIAERFSALQNVRADQLGGGGIPCHRQLAFGSGAALAGSRLRSHRLPAECRQHRGGYDRRLAL